MAIKNDIGTFVHVPKCGGTAITSHIIISGGAEKVGSQHAIPKNIVNGYMTVRHPVPWYRSWWAWRDRHGWPDAQVEGIPDTISCLVSATIHAANLPFDEFVNVITETKPGLYNNFLFFYEVPHIQVYRLEDLDIPYVVNVSINRPDINMETAAKIEESEKAVMERYDYPSWSKMRKSQKEYQGQEVDIKKVMRSLEQTHQRRKTSDVTVPYWEP